MSALSNHLENALANHYFGDTAYSPVANIFTGLSTATPSDTGVGTEVTGGSYARVSLTNNTTNFPNAASGAKQNGVAINFPAATGSWGTVGWAFTHDSTNLLTWGPLSSTQIIANGDTLTFPIGAFLQTFGAGGGISDFLRNGLANLVFGGVALSPAATLHLSLYTIAPNQSGGGTEVTGGSYVRKSFANNTTNFPNASNGVKSLAVEQVFARATADWGTVVAVGLHDASVGGNLLAFFTPPVNRQRAILIGDDYALRANDFTLTFA